MEILLGYVLKGIVLPPGGNLFAMLAAVLMPARWRRRRATLFGIAFGSLWLFCTPWFAGFLAAGLETCPALDPAAQPDAAAIVVLGAGLDERAREYGGQDTPGEDTLVRIRYAAGLALRTQLPLAVAGGTVLDDEARPLGDIMADVLEHEFHVPVAWIERESRNTAGNAAGIAEIVPHRRIVLVTHASHMRRAVAAFERVGFSVVPAPTTYFRGTRTSMSIFSWLPSVGALAVSRAVLHEWVGIAYYAIRYRSVAA